MLAFLSVRFYAVAVGTNPDWTVVALYPVRNGGLIPGM